LGVTADQFHLHCVPMPQQWRIEEHLPLIWFDAKCTYSTPGNAVRKADVVLTVRVFASSPDGAQLYPILNRLILLFDGAKDGQLLWNACPLRARYTAPYRLAGQSPVIPSSIERVYRAELSFATAVLDDRTPRGSFSRIPSPLTSE
ncbi:MAG TPA: hypothetical protein PLE35_12775, partial [Lentisphaeria bacterium]|nr:hypothetical protein [Lentisphaeria bacterium]